MKGKKLLKTYKIKNILFFYVIYILISFLILIFWIFIPTIILSFFLLIAAYHFGKEDSEIMKPKKKKFLNFIFFIKGSLIILAPLFYKFNETVALFEILNFNINIFDYKNLIEIFFYLSLFSNVYFLIENVEENYDFIAFDLLTINLLFYLLSPLAAFTLYFCFIHSLRHTLSLSDQLDKKNLKKGFKKFFFKAIPLTMITAFLFLIFVYIFNIYYTFNESILKVIFIGLASLTFPHILLEYLLEKNEKQT
ncbi:Brp/Blh family beta-carotene 15,15'-dioxygenase [Pelagibacteraceae bacterium]|nr:Brp/Blh family beta-carotene 15,15'-dioxygenase [Pelagibacteraceae bacterium]